MDRRAVPDKVTGWIGGPFISVRMMFIECKPLKGWLAAAILVNQIKERMARLLDWMFL